MHILVINGRSKGQYSITLQTVLTSGNYSTELNLQMVIEGETMELAV